MITSIIFIVAIIFFFCFCFDINPIKFIINRIDNKNKNDINYIKKRFRKLLKLSKNRNIDDVREDIYDTLLYYKQIKTKEYITTKTSLEKSLRDVSSSLDSIYTKKTAQHAHVRKLKDTYLKLKDENLLNQGVNETMILDKYIKIYESLQKAKCSINDKLDKLDSDINLFSSKYELKKAEINLILTNNLVDVNLSTVDINLDDLIVEYQDKSLEMKNTKEITNKINSIDLKEDVIDVEKMKERFLNL